MEDSNMEESNKRGNISKGVIFERLCLSEDLNKADYVSRGLNQGRLCKQRT